MTITAGYFRGLEARGGRGIQLPAGNAHPARRNSLVCFYKDHAQAKAAGTKNMLEVLAKPVLIGIAVAAVSAFIAVKMAGGFQPPRPDRIWHLSNRDRRGALALARWPAL